MRDHSRLWDEVWIPNEIDFDRNYSPRESDEILYSARWLTVPELG